MSETNGQLHFIHTQSILLSGNLRKFLKWKTPSQSGSIYCIVNFTLSQFC